MHLRQEWKLAIYYSGDNIDYKKADDSRIKLQPGLTTWVKMAMVPNMSLSNN